MPRCIRNDRIAPLAHAVENSRDLTRDDRLDIAAGLFELRRTRALIVKLQERLTEARVPRLVREYDPDIGGYGLGGAQEPR